jgi:hypothetical protein
MLGVGAFRPTTSMEHRCCCMGMDGASMRLRLGARSAGVGGHVDGVPLK